MAYDVKNYNELRSLNFTSKDDKFIFKGDKVITNQGLEYTDYVINLSAKDTLLKNYTSNFLINQKSGQEVLDFPKQNLINSLNTKLTFSLLDPISSIRTMAGILDKTDKDSVVLFDSANEVSSSQSFLVDFLDDNYCTISLVDGVTKKYLYRNNDDVNLDLVFLSNSELLTNSLTSRYYFGYAYDKGNNYLKLYNDDKVVTTGFRTLTATYQGLSSNGSSSVEVTLSTFSTPAAPVLSAINLKTSRDGLIKVGDTLDDFLPHNLDQFVYYDYKNNNKVSNESISGLKYDMVSYFPYESITLSGSDLSGTDNTFYANLDFFNLKNHLSQHNITYNAVSALDDELNQRIYYNFTNNKNKETDAEDLNLNYTFFNKEYEILPNKINRLKMPGNLFPYDKININDTMLVENGAFAAKSPYFSDKIFKQTNSNLNNLRNEFVEREEFLVNEDSESFILLQDDNILGFQNLNLVQKNDIFGTYLCTWLKDEDTTATWYDRYYLPDTKSYTVSLTGSTGGQNFIDLTQAKQYFEKNKTNSSYFDIKSNMAFEANAEYLYQRIGKDYVSSMIKNQSAHNIKDSFNIVLSGQELLDRKELNFNLHDGYDSFRIDNIENKNHHISFDLELESLSSLDSYNILGNMYNDGVSFKNNFYFTPFIFLANKNVLTILDSISFELINQITYDEVADIIDVIYVEQNSDIVLLCTNKILVTNVFGEIVSERHVDEQGAYLDELAKSYKSRSFYGSKNLLVYNNNYSGSDSLVYNLDFSNLVITDLGFSFASTSANNAAIYSTLSSQILLQEGFDSRFVKDDFAFSITDEARFISTQNIPGLAFRELGDGSGQADLSAIFLSGMATGFSMAPDLYYRIIPASASSAGAFANFFTFILDGNNKILFDDLSISNSEEAVLPIVDSISRRIDGVNSIEENLYVQTFLSGGGNVLTTITPERYKLSAFPINSSAVSGVGVDFTYEDNTWKVLSFSIVEDGKLLIDKFNTKNGAIEANKTLDYQVNDPASLTRYRTFIEIDPTSADSGFPILSTLFDVNKKLPKYKILSDTEFITISTTVPTAAESPAGYTIRSIITAGTEALSSNRFHNNFTGGSDLYNKYKDVQGDLTFQVNVNTSLLAKFTTIDWASAGPPLEVTGHEFFLWPQPPTGLSAWDGAYSIITSASAANLEFMFKVPNLEINNHLNFDFNYNSGTIVLYNNSLEFGRMQFNPALLPIKRMQTPDIFINTVNFRNQPILSVSPLLSNFKSSNGCIKNLKVYDRSFNKDLVNYLVLENNNFDKLYFDMFNSTKNSIEEIENLYNYRIPGSKNNHGLIHIKNLNVKEENISSLINYVHTNIKNKLPFNMQELSYVVNGNPYHIMDNGEVMTGAIHKTDSASLTTTEINLNIINEQNLSTDSEGGGY